MATFEKPVVSPMERLRARYGLGPADLFVFETIRRSPGRPMSINEIAETTGMKRPTVYLAVGRLAKRGLTARNEKRPRQSRRCRFYYEIAMAGQDAIKQARSLST